MAETQKAKVRIAATAVSVLLGLAAIVGPAAAREPGTETVSVAAERMFAKMPRDYFTIKVVQAHKEISTGSPVVIDVREPKEFAEERIAGARNIPLGSLVKQSRLLPRDRSTPILVYCKSGHRGAMGLTVLRMLGYENVRSIYSGIVGWKNAGLPVTTK